MAYLLIAILAVLIFLAISDIVPALEQAAAELERARDLSRKRLVR